MYYFQIFSFFFILGGNVICLDFWGRKSGPYIQALHFCLSLGLLTGPLLVDPLSRTHVPNVLQKALPFALSHPGAISTSHALHKREVTVGQSSTLDPLLVNIFGAEQPKTSSTVKVPKPKPVFNDGQKLVRFIFLKTKLIILELFPSSHVHNDVISRFF